MNFRRIASTILALECPEPALKNVWESEDGYLLREKFEDALKLKDPKRIDLSLQFIKNQADKLMKGIKDGKYDSPSPSNDDIDDFVKGMDNLFDGKQRVPEGTRAVKS